MTKQIAPPAATGNAGPQFEEMVGAFYLLSILACGEPRGLPGATIKTVAFQQRSSGRPLDDVVIHAKNGDGSDAILEIQAKRTLTFTKTDSEFVEVVAQIWEVAHRSAFETTRYELAVAIARSTTRVEHACQEVLRWARQLPDGATFAAHISRKAFASDAMRDFVGVFRANLGKAGAPNNDETVWRLLRRFQILAFDFESPGSDYEHRARERARFVLNSDQAHRAADLWPVLCSYAGSCASAGGSRSHAEIVDALKQTHGYRFETRADLRVVDDRLAASAETTLEEIRDQVGGVRLARSELVNQAQAALERGRMVHISGAPGVGKSAVLKHLAQRIEPEGRIIVLRNGRITPGGWQAMAHVVGCNVSQVEFFNELGCGGGATLFIDNIDQIIDVGEWSTIHDLLRFVAITPGWRAVSTGGTGSDDWKTRLPSALVSAGIATIAVDAISDSETDLLAESNQALALILRGDHPASKIARNLFYLSRMIELGFGQADAAIIATELDLARLWWRYGGGRSEDSGRLARLKALRVMGSQVIAESGRVAFKVDDFPSQNIVAELLRFDSIREEIKGSTVAFRHDVLRDWTVGFQFHEDPTLLGGLFLDKAIAPVLARSLEIAARLALESDTTGGRWSELLAVVERDGSHGSWARSILLALPRAELALQLFQSLKPVLLEGRGRRLGEIVRLMLAVESEPLSQVLARTQPTLSMPEGVGDFVVPKGISWAWLTLWLVATEGELPDELIPEVTKAFQAFLMATHFQQLEVNTNIVGILFRWLTLIEEAMKPRMWREEKDVPQPLNVRHLRDVRNDLRMTAFSFAHLNPTAAEVYLAAINPDEIRHDEIQAIFQSPASLVRAAPKTFAALVLAALIEEDEPEHFHGSRRRWPFGVVDSLFTPVSPGQGPFFELLQGERAVGLDLIRCLVMHVTRWQREDYEQAGLQFPRIKIKFPAGEKAFEGDWAIYHMARTIMPSGIVTSALMALEGWAHQEIEKGRPFEQILHDVLGPDGSSAAFLLVATDLALSHWSEAKESVWPLAASPELLHWDDQRFNRDVAGVDRLPNFEQESAAWRVRRSDLEGRPSRQRRLSDTFGEYLFGGGAAIIDALRANLEQARDIIAKANDGDEEKQADSLLATANRAVRMTFADNWPLVKVKRNDGSEAQVRRFVPDLSEARLKAERARAAQADLEHRNLVDEIRLALLEPEKSTAKIIHEGVVWAKGLLPQSAQKDVGNRREDFREEIDRLAAVMVAALVARDYIGSDLNETMPWALTILEQAAVESGDEYRGNDQIEYNSRAIATVGLVAVFLKRKEVSVRQRLLRLAAHRHKAVLKAFGENLLNVARQDERLPRSIIRVGVLSATYPRRSTEEREGKALKNAHRAMIENAIGAEEHWLSGEAQEPAWPQLPPWLSHPRRRVRIGGVFETDSDHDDDVSSFFVDEQFLGELIGQLVRFAAGVPPQWLVDLATHFMVWTTEANGPHDPKDHDRDNRPHTWNVNFFEFIGILGVALPHQQVVEKFIEPMTRYRDESFYDGMASFLRGFDRATFAIDTKYPENPVAVRDLFADRIRQGWNYKRLGYEKGTTSERHAGDALNAMFYQPSQFANRGYPTISSDWLGLEASMPTLTALVTGAPSSGYLASLFLNLLAACHRATLLPFVVQATASWCAAYGVDPNFWAEKEVGGKTCRWINQTLSVDTRSVDVLPMVHETLLGCLDVLIRSGVAQAHDVEERVVEIGQSRKS